MLCIQSKNSKRHFGTNINILFCSMSATVLTLWRPELEEVSLTIFHRACLLGVPIAFILANFNFENYFLTCWYTFEGTNLHTQPNISMANIWLSCPMAVSKNFATKNHYQIGRKHRVQISSSYQPPGFTSQDFFVRFWTRFQTLGKKYSWIGKPQLENSCSDAIYQYRPMSFEIAC